MASRAAYRFQEGMIYERKLLHLYSWYIFEKQCVFEESKVRLELKTRF
jgi:hypothetical protein